MQLSYVEPCTSLQCHVLDIDQSLSCLCHRFGSRTKSVLVLILCISRLDSMQIFSTGPPLTNIRHHPSTPLYDNSTVSYNTSGEFLASKTLAYSSPSPSPSTKTQLSPSSGCSGSATCVTGTKDSHFASSSTHNTTSMCPDLNVDSWYLSAQVFGTERALSLHLPTGYPVSTQGIMALVESYNWTVLLIYLCLDE